MSLDNLVPPPMRKTQLLNCYGQSRCLPLGEKTNVPQKLQQKYMQAVKYFVPGEIQLFPQLIRPLLFCVLYSVWLHRYQRAILSSACDSFPGDRLGPPASKPMQALK